MRRIAARLLLVAILFAATRAGADLGEFFARRQPARFVATPALQEGFTFGGLFRGDRARGERGARGGRRGRVGQGIVGEAEPLVTPRGGAHDAGGFGAGAYDFGDEAFFGERGEREERAPAPRAARALQQRTIFEVTNEQLDDYARATSQGYLGVMMAEGRGHVLWRYGNTVVDFNGTHNLRVAELRPVNQTPRYEVLLKLSPEAEACIREDFARLRRSTTNGKAELGEYNAGGGDWGLNCVTIFARRMARLADGRWTMRPLNLNVEKEERTRRITDPEDGLERVVRFFVPRAGFRLMDEGLGRSLVQTLGVERRHDSDGYVSTSFMKYLLREAEGRDGIEVAGVAVHRGNDVRPTETREADLRRMEFKVSFGGGGFFGF
ncbi:MAG: hypothetical protein IT371_06670 [Deltaproteobacteria bacterium]|nr:hypothetical protein [Deltaproteobacteria bacterium]